MQKQTLSQSEEEAELIEERNKPAADVAETSSRWRHAAV